MSLVPWDNLQDYVHDWMKGLQVIVDSIAPDPGADNSMLPLASLPYKFDSTGYFSFNVRDITSDYSTSQYGYGYQKFVYGARVNLTNDKLRIMSLQYVGKNVDTSPGTWDKVESVLPQINTAREALITDGSVYITNPYEDTYETIVSANASKIYFYPFNHSESDISIVYPNVGGDITKAGFSLSLQSTPITENAQGLIEPSISRNVAQIDHYSGDKTIAVFGRDSYAQHLVNAASQYSTNNDVINYTKAGSEYKLYYGDNYLVYALNSSNVYNYQDLFTGTKQATDTINTWNPSDPPIKTPTYEEVKHEDDPPIDKDIEVEMDLNDAAYGAGMSHYYVTTTTSGVLDDISAAMSTWNINNTGKDLYRNLLSCRLTKVGPIPAKNSTFVIYGEELQYNGAPISINEITGNPSMDLGEYEILPKFNDFRDYAPYTKIEMYVPYCGWVVLPSHCMSSEEDPKIITGTLLCDIIAGTCKAVIKCNDTVVAEAAGFTAVDVPFVGENVGMKMAGIASSITSYGSNAAKTVGGIAGGMSGGGPAGAAAAGGVVSLLGSYAQLNAAFNANYTEICGKTGDGCNVAGLNKVYIKIQRPKTNGYEEPDFVPGDYGHTTGFLCMQKMKVSDCSGLIIASNADVSGIGSATDAERAEIKRVLETGLFVNAAPEPPEPEE